jgi:hypothetical protein
VRAAGSGLVGGGDGGTFDVFRLAALKIERKKEMMAVGCGPRERCARAST